MALTRHLLRLRKDRQKYDRLLTRAFELRDAEKETSDALVERVIIGSLSPMARARTKKRTCFKICGQLLE